jgi:hypothetical protein
MRMWIVPMIFKKSSFSFSYLVDLVGRCVGDEAPFAIPPSDFNLEFPRLPCCKYPHCIVAGTIAAPCDHFLGLGNRTARDFYFRSNSSGVFPGSFESDCYPGCGRLIAIDTSWRVKAINDDVQVTIIVEVGKCHSVSDSHCIKAPRCAHILESKVVPVAEDRTGSFPPGDFFELGPSAAIAFPVRCTGSPAGGIQILDIVVVSSRY